MKGKKERKKIKTLISIDVRFEFEVDMKILTCKDMKTERKSEADAKSGKG